VAARLFDERGFARTRAEDIAAALNIAKPTLYTRTAGKSALLEAVIDRVISALGEQAQAVLDADGTPGQRLEALFSHHVRQAIQYRSYFNVFFRDDRELPPRARARFRRWARDYTSRLTGLVEHAMAAGEVDPALDAEMVAISFLATANWVCRWYVDGKRLSPDEVVAETWRVLASGLSPRAAAPRSSPTNGEQTRRSKA